MSCLRTSLAREWHERSYCIRLALENATWANGVYRYGFHEHQLIIGRLPNIGLQYIILNVAMLFWNLDTLSAGRILSPASSAYGRVVDICGIDI